MDNPGYDKENGTNNTIISNIKDVELNTDIENNESKEKIMDLLLTTNQSLTKPLFRENVRAYADAQKFTETATIIVKSACTTLEEIVRELLQKMLTKWAESKDVNIEHLIESSYNALLVANRDIHGSDYYQFRKAVQGFEYNHETGDLTIDPTWLITMASLNGLSERLFGLVTLTHTVNLGDVHSGVQTLAIVLTPYSTKTTKNEIETSINVATVLSDLNLRFKIHHHVCESQIRVEFSKTADQLKEDNIYAMLDHVDRLSLSIRKETPVTFGRGIYYDVKHRLKYYVSDYADAFRSKDAFLKTFTTIVFLFFANLLPTIAFGMLNETNTNGKINVAKGLLAQIIGGVGFAIFGGQHMTILLTTAPLSIIIFVLYEISSQLGLPFFGIYALVGVFNSFYILIYAFLGCSKVMKFSTRSTEEIFALFISIAFIVDSVKACVKSFDYYYYGSKCVNKATESLCTKEESLLFLLLLTGTVIFGLWLKSFAESPFLIPMVRRLVSDFSLPVAVLLMSFFGSYVFRDVKMHNFKATTITPDIFNVSMPTSQITEMNLTGILIAAGLALPLSILFFMDQNISSSMINTPDSGIRKGAAYHWDLVVVSALNLILSLLGLPWVHGALPHSPMHVQSLATKEEHVDQGNHITYRVVSVVETRLTSAMSNVLVGACLLLMPVPLLYLPSPVLYGLFLYMAITGVSHNQMFERLLLLFTEQSAYPPNYYLRRVPQRKVHIFTFLQVIQLLMLCALGFTPVPYVKMAFPVLLLILLVIRHVIVPRIISKRYLDALDKSI